MINYEKFKNSKKFKDEDALFQGLIKCISYELEISYKLAEDVFAYVFNNEFSENWNFDNSKGDLVDSVESLVELIKDVENDS